VDLLPEDEVRGCCDDGEALRSKEEGSAVFVPYIERGRYLNTGAADSVGGVVSAGVVSVPDIERGRYLNTGARGSVGGVVSSYRSGDERRGGFGLRDMRLRESDEGRDAAVFGRSLVRREEEVFPIFFFV